MMAADRKPIVVVGSINMDMVVYSSRIPAPGETLQGSDFQLHPGGKGANQAVAIGRLGYPVQMIGCVGDDAFGPQLKVSLVSAGVSVDCVATVSGPSGVAAIAVADGGQNCIVVVPGANALLTPQDLERHVHVIRSAGMVLTQLETPLETVIYLAELCQREGVPLMLDPAPARPLPDALLQQVAWFTPNETEAGFFVSEAELASAEETPSDFSAVLLQKGPQGVVLKLGARGSCVKVQGGPATMVAPVKVEAVDTVAAGDCFNGAFAVGLMAGMKPSAAAGFASAAAAISVTRAGAQPSMPRLDEVQDLQRRMQP